MKLPVVARGDLSLVPQHETPTLLHAVTSFVRELANVGANVKDPEASAWVAKHLISVSGADPNSTTIDMEQFKKGLRAMGMDDTAVLKGAQSLQTPIARGATASNCTTASDTAAADSKPTESSIAVAGPPNRTLAAHRISCGPGGRTIVPNSFNKPTGRRSTDTTSRAPVSSSAWPAPARNSPAPWVNVSAYTRSLPVL